jgi:Protein of unknown function (DUF2474)
MTKLNGHTLSVHFWQRLGWFGAIWAGSVVALAIVAWVLKWAVKAPV